MEKASLAASNSCPNTSPLKVRSLEETIRAAYRPGCCPKYATEYQDDQQKLNQLCQIKREQEYADRLRQQREKIQVLRVEFDQKAEELIDARDEIQRLKHENQALHRYKLQFNCYQAEKDKLLYQLNQAVEDRDFYKAKLDSFQGQGLEEVIVKLKDELLTVNSSLQKSYVTNSNLERTIATLKLQIQDYEENLNYHQRESKIRLDAAEKEIDKLKKENLELKMKIECYEGASGSTMKERDDLEAIITGLKNQIRKLDDQVSCKDQVILNIKEDLARLGVRHHKQLLNLTTELERRTSQLQKKDAQVNELKLKLEEANLKIKALNDDNIILREQNEDLQRQIRKLTIEVEFTKSNKGDNVINELQRELDEKNKKLACLGQWRLHDKQVRNDLGTLRLEARQAKVSEIEKIDELITQIGVKHLKKKYR